MPFGMGPAGWYAWPYMAYWMSYGTPQWPYPYVAPPWFWTEEDERTFLEDQADMLEAQLTEVKKRLSELEKQKKEKK